MTGTAAEPPILRRRRSPPPMPVPKAIFLYLFIVFAGAALIAPRVYHLVQSLGWHFPGLASLAAYPFHRFVNRCLIILALIGLWPFIKALQISSWSELGLKSTRRHWAESFHGFAWGFITLAAAAILALSFEAREPDLAHSAARWMKHFRNAAAAALLVGFIEELLFRGALFGSLRRDRSFWSAAFISSVVYALLHFFERPANPPQIEWDSGFFILAQMLRGFTDWHALVPGFLNLTLVGLILALAFERTGSILFSFGLHAGFIFWVKSFDFITDPAPGASSWLWGSGKLIDGWVAGAMLLILFLILHRILPRTPRVVVHHDPGSLA